MRFLDVFGRVTPEGLFKALVTVAGLLQVIVEVLSFLIRLSKKYQE